MVLFSRYRLLRPTVATTVSLVFAAATTSQFTCCVGEEADEPSEQEEEEEEEEKRQEKQEKQEKRHPQQQYLKVAEEGMGRVPCQTLSGWDRRDLCAAQDHCFPSQGLCLLRAAHGQQQGPEENQEKGAGDEGGLEGKQVAEKRRASVQRQGTFRASRDIVSDMIQEYAIDEEHGDEIRSILLKEGLQGLQEYMRKQLAEAAGEELERLRVDNVSFATTLLHELLEDANLPAKAGQLVGSVVSDEEVLRSARHLLFDHLHQPGTEDQLLWLAAWNRDWLLRDNPWMDEQAAWLARYLAAHPATLDSAVPLTAWVFACADSGVSRLLVPVLAQAVKDAGPPDGGVAAAMMWGMTDALQSSWLKEYAVEYLRGAMKDATEGGGK